MIARHRNIPRLWLMTDERVNEDDLLAAVRRLPRGSGLIFRHYGLDRHARRALFDHVRAIARRRGIAILLAGGAGLAAAWGADGWHGLGQDRRRGRFLHSAPAHDVRQMRGAERAGVDLLFVSPIFPTRSHPGARSLGRVRFGLLARQAREPVIALGGMTAHRARGLNLLGLYGWAAIDALTERDQNLKIVPR